MNKWLNNECKKERIFTAYKTSKLGVYLPSLTLTNTMIYDFTLNYE